MSIVIPILVGGTIGLITGSLSGYAIFVAPQRKMEEQEKQEKIEKWRRGAFQQEGINESIQKTRIKIEDFEKQIAREQSLREEERMYKDVGKQIAYEEGMYNQIIALKEHIKGLERSRDDIGKLRRNRKLYEQL